MPPIRMRDGISNVDAEIKFEEGEVQKQEPD